MQMYLFNPAQGILTFVVNSPASIAGPYSAVEGAFSPNNLLGNVGPRTANLVWFNDDAAGTTHYACNPAANAAALNGKIALIMRGFGGPCTVAVPFTQKVLNAQAAGAIGVVMVNNVPGPPIVMGGGPDPTIVTPAIMISDIDGATIAAQITNPFVNVTMSSTPPGTVQLDGDIDNGVVAHEFFHGVSNRLTGGPANSSCLNNAEEGGEGWSDYNGLMTTTDWSTALITDGFNKKRPMGTYAFGQPPTGGGIRLYPYCTNIAINPLTYSNMGVAPVGTEVHNIGEIWCMALWEMTWQIIQTAGINTNLFNNAGTGGNSVAYKLVIEGMKLQPCNPGYIDARNAILQADQNLYGGAHVCAIWTAFAKRGMGFSASEGSPFSATDQTPAFDLPPGAVFTTQPTNATTCAGSTVSFTGTATGATGYQWQVSTTGCGGTFVNVTNVAPYSGATTNTLTINPAAIGMNGYAYRLVGTTLCGSGNSNCAVLTVVPGAVGGTVTPANTNVCATPNSTLLTLSGNVGPVSTWQSSTTGPGGPWTAIPGTAGQQTYTATNVAVTTWYSAFISAVGCASATSSAASVTVLPGALPMYIVADPGTTLCEGDPTRLTVMEGAGTTTVNISQSTSQTITAGNSVSCNTGLTTNVNSFWRVYPLTSFPAITGNYTITNVNFGIELTSGGPQNVTVNLYDQTGGAFPGGTRTLIKTQVFSVPNINIGFFNATFTTPITVSNSQTIVVEVMTAGVANTRFFIGSNTATENSPSYLSAPLCGITTPTTTAAIGFPNMHIILDIGGTIPGAGGIVTGGTFLWTPAAGLSSTTTNPVAASPAVTTTYTVTHNNGAGCIRTAQITINVNTRPKVTTNPSNTTVCSGSAASFTVAGTGTGLTYQWQVSTTGCAGPWTNLVNGAPYSGVTTATLNINPTSGAMNGYGYRCVLGGTCPPGLGNPNISSCAILTTLALPTVTITPPGPLCGGVAGSYGVSLTTGGVSLPPVPGTQSFTSGTINLAVPDNDANGVSNVINAAGVPANATITNITVALNNFSHTYPGDMIIHLKAPNGTILNLYKYGNGLFTGPVSGNSTWGWYGAKISSTGTVASSTVAVAPFIYNNSTNWKADMINGNVAGPTIQNPTGFVSTATSWNQMGTTGPAMNGAWTLAMCDGGGGDRGTLTSWDLKIDYTVPNPAVPFQYVWTPAAGLYLDPAATIPYVAGSSQSTVYAAPAATTLYTVTITDNATLCTNTATVLVYSTPPAPLVTPNPVAMCLGDPAVRLISTSAVPGTCTVSSGPISVAIPDANPTNTQNFTVTSTQAVNCIPANATITGIAVTLSIPAHTYVADLSFNLKSPSGTVINLFRNLGATGGVNTTYPNTGIVNLTLSSASALSLATANNASVGTLSGTYKADIRNAISAPFYTLGDPPGYPSTATSWTPMFNNAAGAANGNWILALTDDGAGDVGTLTNWSIKFDYFTGVQSTQAVWTPTFPGPNNYLWLDAAQNFPYIAGTQHDTVYTRPTPAGVYNYNVTVNSLPPPPVTVTTPMAGGNGNQMVLFNLQNTTATNYTLKSISTNVFASGTATTVNLWMKTTAPIAGNPGSISNANGWNIVGTASGVACTANTLNQVISNMNVSVPAGANYGVALEFIGAVFPAYTNGTGTIQTYTNNGINIITDGNVGWGGPVAPGPPANNPRNFNGAVSLTAPGGLCTSPARVVTVTVSNPVVITTQPVNRTVCTNGTTSFTVAATGSGVTYQWQVSTDAGNTFTNITNNANYSGATTATLTITNPPVAWNGYQYRVLVNGVLPCPSVPSNKVVLTVNPLPTISITAAPYRNLLPGLTTALTATSSPAAATYQWFRNGVAVAGGTVNPLIVNVDGIGTYTVRITDVNGCTNTSGSIVIGDSTSGRVWIYPNPTGGVFGVRYNPTHNNVLPRGINIYDATGKRILTQKYTLGIPFAPMVVDLSNYSSGVYWVEVVDVDDQRLAVGRVEILR